MYGYFEYEPEFVKMDIVAKKLNIKGFGRNNLFKFLKRKNVLDDYNCPREEFVENGYFKPIIMELETPRGYIFWRDSCKVSKKGIEFIKNLILENQ